MGWIISWLDTQLYLNQSQVEHWLDYIDVMQSRNAIIILMLDSIMCLQCDMNMLCIV
jgi:hypothetical protein